MTFYRHILKSAWGKTWHYKYLWFFGLFAALLGNGGAYEVLFQALSGKTRVSLFGVSGAIIRSGILSVQGLTNLGKKFLIAPFTVSIILFGALLFVAFFILMLWLAIVSKAALIKNTAQISLKKKHSLQLGVEAARKHFWSVFGLVAIAKLVSWAAVVIYSWQFLTEIDHRGLLFKIVLFFLIIPLSVAISFIVNYAMAYAVIKKERFLTAVQSAWSLFLKNWVITLEMGILLLFINIITVVFVLVIFVFVTTPFLIFLSYYPAAFAVFLFLGALFVFFLVILAGSFLATFQTAAWTKIFLELESRGGVSKITRFFDSF